MGVRRRGDVAVVGSLIAYSLFLLFLVTIGQTVSTEISEVRAALPVTSPTLAVTPPAAVAFWSLVASPFVLGLASLGRFPHRARLILRGVAAGSLSIQALLFITVSILLSPSVVLMWFAVALESRSAVRQPGHVSSLPPPPVMPSST